MVGLLTMLKKRRDRMGEATEGERVKEKTMKRD